MIYDFTARDIDGNQHDLRQYKDEVLLIVNTASKCGFTPQYADLQKLHERYATKGLRILGFPCNQFMAQEPGNSAETKAFCEFNYGVSFQLFEKIDVNGSYAHPIFKYLTSQAPYEGMDLSLPSNKILDAMLKEKFPEFTIGNSIRWNFTKFLVSRNGSTIRRFEPTVEPLDMVSEIESFLSDK